MIQQNVMTAQKSNYAFVDASNLFYGGEKSLGWRVDYLKLLKYLKFKYNIKRVLYFGGVEIYDFEYDYLLNQTVPLELLTNYLENLVESRAKKLNEAQLFLIGKHLQRVKFYLKLQDFGYSLFLKPVKMYSQEDGTTRRKANCDVDMAFYLMKEKEHYNDVVILSGDGDFLPVLKYLKESGKEIIILARGERTSKELRQFAGSNFRDFVRLRKQLEYKADKK